MMINEETEALIKSFEKLRLNSYHGAADADGIYTIGWGHVITGHEDPDIFKPGQLMWDVSITNEQAEQLFQSDIQVFVRGVQMRLDKEKAQQLTDDEFGALVSLAYNIGLGNFGISAVRQTINNGQIADAAHGFSSWISSNGQHVNGLIRRRAAEKALFLSDLDTSHYFRDNSNSTAINKAMDYLGLNDD